MDKDYIVDLVRAFAERARQALDVRQIILFGSYANDTATPDSDIDVAVITTFPVADWLESSAELYKISGGIDLSMEPHLMDCSSDRSGFLEHIRQTGEIIYDSERA